MNSANLKAAFKLAVAVLLAYWIALTMDRPKPFWAGITIVGCALTTTGESVQKVLLRLGGTFLAIFVSIMLDALVPPHKWF